MIEFSSDFDSGNGELVDIRRQSETAGSSSETITVLVSVKNDIFTELEQVHHKQWFHFRLSNIKNEIVNVVISNAGQCAFPSAWSGYNVCASIDRKEWFRIPTSYCHASGQLSWRCQPTTSQIYFAYFPPFSREMHLDLIARCQSMNRDCNVRTIGKSLDKRDIHIITVGSGSRNVWFIARQHPGESMGEFFIQGLLNRLLDSADGLSRMLLLDATFHIVPNINPDGSYRGHLRTNAAGANLNREWCSTGNYIAPTLERSPEVYHGKPDY